jgi:hypothetical protein
MKKIRTFLNFLFGMLLVAPVYAFALSAPSITLGNPAPGAGSTLEDFVYLLIDIVQWVGLPLLALCIIYAGFILVSAGGNEQQITKGKLWILWTLVGAAIVLGARVIADIVFGTASVF